MAVEVREGRLAADAITPELLGRHLHEPDLPDPDVIIRTSGEQRLSNYLMWQSAYSELYFTDVLWPDFSRDDFEAALREYDARRRRFGRGRDLHAASYDDGCRGGGVGCGEADDQPYAGSQDGRDHDVDGQEDGCLDDVDGEEGSGVEDDRNEEDHRRRSRRREEASSLQAWYRRSS